MTHRLFFFFHIKTTFIQIHKHLLNLIESCLGALPLCVIKCYYCGFEISPFKNTSHFILARYDILFINDYLCSCAAAASFWWGDWAWGDHPNCMHGSLGDPWGTLGYTHHSLTTLATYVFEFITNFPT